MGHHLTMIAYDMNDQPLTFGYGAPLRFRNEIELGFKQVKWIKGIQFVADYSELSSGHGDYKDHEFFGYRQSIERGHRTQPTVAPGRRRIRPRRQVRPLNTPTTTARSVSARRACMAPVGTTRTSP